MSHKPANSLETVISPNERGATPAPVVDSFDNLVSIQRPGFSPVAFHVKNMEVASISPEALGILNRPDHALRAGRELDAADLAASEILAWNESVNPDVRPGTVKFGPRALTINVTQVCNLHCTYCAAGGDGSFGDPIKRISVEKTLPQLKSMLDRVPAGKKFRITFLGGEPLLYPEGIRLLADYARELARERDIEMGFVVVTNGTLFSDANIQLLCDLHAKVTVSIDGPAGVNDKTRPSRGGEGVTAKVAAGLTKLLERKDELETVELSGVFGKQNLDLMASYEFYAGFGVDSFDFIYDHLEVSPELSDKFTRLLSEVADRAYAEGGEKALRRIKIFDYVFDLLDKQQQVENYCGSGKSFFMIDARNNVYSCPWVVGDSKEIVGHGTEIWTDRLKKFQAPLVETNGCGGCWARNLCGGGCMFIHKNKTGSKHQTDENFCKRTKDLIALGILYYERARALSTTEPEAPVQSEPLAPERKAL